MSKSKWNCQRLPRKPGNYVVYRSNFKREEEFFGPYFLSVDDTEDNFIGEYSSGCGCCSNWWDFDEVMYWRKLPNTWTEKPK